MKCGDRGSTVVKVLRYSMGTAVAQWLRYCAAVGDAITGTFVHMLGAFNIYSRA
jgi:hypothetical protein